MDSGICFRILEVGVQEIVHASATVKRKRLQGSAPTGSGWEVSSSRGALGWVGHRGQGPVLKVGEYVRFPPFCHLHPWLRVRPQACGTHNPQREELISAVAPNTEEKPGSWEVVRRMAWLDP